MDDNDVMMAVRIEEALREQVRALETRLAQETARAVGQEEFTKAAVAALEERGLSTMQIAERARDAVLASAPVEMVVTAGLDETLEEQAERLTRDVARAAEAA